MPNGNAKGCGEDTNDNKKLNNLGILYERKSEIKRFCYNEKIITDVNDTIVQMIVNLLVGIKKEDVTYYTTKFRMS